MKELLAAEKPRILAELKRDPAKHALVIQNLTTFPHNSKFFYTEKKGELSYTHISGHPAHSRGPSKVLVADGNPTEVANLLRELKIPAPFSLRESPASIEQAVLSIYPEGHARREYRMDVSRSTFKARHQGMARALGLTDVSALCAFMGSPPQAAGQFAGWIQGAKVFQGIVENGQIRAIGSSMVCLPEVFNIVSIETHKDHRGKGYATELTSSLVAECLKHTDKVCLTVFTDNEPALKLYRKLGFEVREERTWIDCK